MTDTDPFTTRRVGTIGHEIRDPDGNVVAWAVDKPWAALIAGLLNRVEAEGLWKKRVAPRPPADEEDSPNTVRGLREQAPFSAATAQKRAWTFHRSEREEE